MVHIIQQESFENPGMILEWLDMKGIEYQITHVYKDQIKLTDSPELIIIMGGTASVQQTDKYPHLTPLKQYLKEQYKQGTKMLGICLGAQLLAELIGASVYGNNCQEIGWFPVQFSTELLSSTLFNFFPKEQVVMHWHSDTFDIPTGAVHLGGSVATPNQGFVFEDKICALQFHIETTSESLKPLVSRLGHTLQKDTWVQVSDEILAGEKYTKSNYELLDKILSAFLIV